jgi:hypothetical protein
MEDVARRCQELHRRRPWTPLSLPSDAAAPPPILATASHLARSTSSSGRRPPSPEAPPTPAPLDLHQVLLALLHRRVIGFLLSNNLGCRLKVHPFLASSAFCRWRFPRASGGHALTFRLSTENQNGGAQNVLSHVQGLGAHRYICFHHEMCGQKTLGF